MSDLNANQRLPAEFHEDPELRALIARWTSSTPSPRRRSLQSALREYLQRDTTACDQVMPIKGELWLQRQGGRNPMPVRMRTDAGAGDALYIAQGGTARVQCPDGSEMMLREQSVLLIASPQESEEQMRYHLERGELFVRVVPREKDAPPFGVSTPGGTVQVMGTEFGVAVRADKQMRVIVRRGRVLVRAREKGTGQQVNRNQEIIVGSGAPSEVRAISPRRVRADTRWAEKDSPRGKQILALVIAAVLLAVVGVFLFSWKEAPRFDDKGMRLLAPDPELRGTLNGSSFFNGSEAIEFTIHSQLWKDGAWKDTSVMTWNYEPVMVQDDAATIRAELAEFESDDYWAQYMRDFNRLSGWSFTYHVDQSGNVTVDDLGLEPELKGAGGVMVMTALSYSPLRMLPPSHVTPGEEWNRSWTVGVEGSPHAFMKAEDDYTMEGWVRQYGRVMAKVIKDSEGEFGGMTVRMESGPDAKHYSLFHHSFSGRMEFYFDRATGRLVGGKYDGENTETYQISSAETMEQTMAGNIQKVVGAPIRVRTWFTAEHHLFEAKQAELK